MAVKRTSAEKAKMSPGNQRIQTALHMEALTGWQVNWQSGHGSFRTDAEKIFCFINREGKLALKLPTERIEELVAGGEARFLTMGKRTMREWAVVPVPESKSELKLLKEAKTFVESEAAKPKRRGK